jgi:hypothetical protein
MRRRRAIMLSLLVLLVGTTAAAKKPRPKLHGAYDVTFAGEWTGTGHAAVGAQNININAKLLDAAGNTVHLQASGLSLEEYRFSGDGKLDGTPVIVMGRVEEGVSDGTPRVVGTIQDPVGKRYGRFVGERKGP